jgi:hypothetical protein
VSLKVEPPDRGARSGGSLLGTGGLLPVAGAVRSLGRDDGGRGEVPGGEAPIRAGTGAGEGGGLDGPPGEMVSGMAAGITRGTGGLGDGSPTAKSSTRCRAAQ